MIEQTTIKQENPFDHQKYRFELILNNSKSLYQSKSSILDRPNWKNEKVKILLGDSEDLYMVNIYRNTKRDVSRTPNTNPKKVKSNIEIFD